MINPYNGDPMDWSERDIQEHDQVAEARFDGFLIGMLVSWVIAILLLLGYTALT